MCYAYTSLLIGLINNQVVLFIDILDVLNQALLVSEIALRRPISIRCHYHF